MTSRKPRPRKTTSGTSRRDWMIYGANGFTGSLIAREAVRRGLRPILAGRGGESVRSIANGLGLESRIFPLDDHEKICRGLEGCAAVLLAAGPFSATYRPILEACLTTGVHYLDITGEWEVFEACHALDARARSSGIVVMPGVGFDVVPSDCLAAILKERLPQASSLELAFHSVGPVSGGTIKTMLEALPAGGVIRNNAVIERVPLFWRARTVRFHDRTRRAVSIPWGDVSTAYHSTGIGNIVVYLAVPGFVPKTAPALRMIMPLLRQGIVVGAANKAVDFFNSRSVLSLKTTDRCELWGEVSDAAGRTASGTLTVPGTYALTAQTAVESVRRVVEGTVAAGAVTPSRAFGASYITEFEGCTLRVG